MSGEDQWTERLSHQATGAASGLVAVALILEGRSEVRPHDRLWLRAETNGFSAGSALPNTRRFAVPVELQTRIQATLEDWPTIQGPLLSGVLSPLEDLAQSVDSGTWLSEPLSSEQHRMIREWLRTGYDRPTGSHGLQLQRAIKIIPPQTSRAVTRSVRQEVLNILDDCRIFEERVAWLHRTDVGLQPEQTEELERRLRQARSSSSARPGATFANVVLDGLVDVGGAVLVAAVKSIALSLIGGTVVGWGA